MIRFVRRPGGHQDLLWMAAIMDRAMQNKAKKSEGRKMVD
jgi:hypothetical protein